MSVTHDNERSTYDMCLHGEIGVRPSSMVRPIVFVMYFFVDI